MTIKIQGTNTTAAPGITGGDTDTGVQFGTNEVKIVTDGTDRIVVDSTGASTFSGNLTLGATAPNSQGSTYYATAVDLRRDDGGAVYNVFRGGNALANQTIALRSDGAATFAGAVKIGGTAAANQMDEYEEGTWTPTYASGISGVGYTNTGATYTRIGNVVYITVRINASSGTNTSSRAEISGLPFQAHSTAREGGCVFSYMHGIHGDHYGPVLLIGAGTSKIYFYDLNGGNWNGDEGNGLLGQTLHMHGFYFV